LVPKNVLGSQKKLKTKKMEEDTIFKISEYYGKQTPGENSRIIESNGKRYVIISDTLMEEGIFETGKSLIKNIIKNNEIQGKGFEIILRKLI